MTSQPRPCHYDKTLGYRVTNRHTDDCPRDQTCPAAGHGCEPCPEPHCSVCGREHATHANPQTCPTCLTVVDQDLDDIQTAYTALSIEALEAGRDGRLAAAAPIPGGDAQVLIGPTVRLDMLRTYRGWTPEHVVKDHAVSARTGKSIDPLPPLAILADWEDRYRTWLDHTGGQRATIAAAIAYLKTQLRYIAQQSGDGPDWLTFTRTIRSVRSQLEHVLHDEREPERGVECFECGDQLVRRFRDAKRCRHRTPARDELRRWLENGYPEAVTAADVRASRRPCGRCDQGGIDDPSAGLSWECPGCRKEYKPGEYANAVRRDLLDNGASGDGWTHIRMAADAASTLVGVPISDERLRKWADRGKVTSCCAWSEGVAWGQRLVYWPDVADEAAAAVERARKAAEARQRKAAKDAS